MRLSILLGLFVISAFASRKKPSESKFEDEEDFSTVEEETEDNINQNFDDISPDDILTFELEPWEDLVFYQDIETVPAVLKGIYFLSSGAATKIDLKVKFHFNPGNRSKQNASDSLDFKIPRLLRTECNQGGHLYLHILQQKGKEE